MEKSLTSLAHAWLLDLPPHHQPLATARRHPHIVNRLSALWQNPPERSTYFSELLKTRRQGRNGFSFGVLTELTDLCAWMEKIGPDHAAGSEALNDQQQSSSQTKQKTAASGARFVDQRR